MFLPFCWLRIIRLFDTIHERNISYFFSYYYNHHHHHHYCCDNLCLYCCCSKIISGEKVIQLYRKMFYYSFIRLFVHILIFLGSFPNTKVLFFVNILSLRKLISVVIGLLLFLLLLLVLLLPLLITILLWGTEDWNSVCMLFNVLETLVWHFTNSN